MGNRKKIKIKSDDPVDQNPDETGKSPEIRKTDQSSPTSSFPNDDTPATDTDMTGSEETVASQTQTRKDLEAQLEAALNEAKESYDRLLRTSAEFENYKKRTARQMEDFKKYANQALIKDLLSVVDNLELALKSSKQNQGEQNGLLDGVDLTLKEVMKVFEKYHVTPIDALGKPFDPKFHEAVMREESEEYSENTVINEMQKGYLIHDRLLRPAMVVVAMPKSARGENSKA